MSTRVLFIGPQEVNRVRLCRRPSGRDPPHPGVSLLSWPASHPPHPVRFAIVREMSSGAPRHRGWSRACLGSGGRSDHHSWRIDPAEVSSTGRVSRLIGAVTGSLAPGLAAGQPDPPSNRLWRRPVAGSRAETSTGRLAMEDADES
jgi:hypothetical protein